MAESILFNIVHNEKETNNIMTILGEKKNIAELGP